MNGIFITFEGIDGAGKTTVLKRLQTVLGTDSKITYTREPGGTEVSDKIRSIIIENELDAKTELMLFLASRREHILNKIQPALSRGEIVISDRFADSNTIYQGLGRGLGEEYVSELNKYICEDLTPDVTFLLDISSEDSLNRLQKNGRAMNNFDKESQEFREKIRDGFLDLAKENNDRFIILDGMKDVDTLCEDIFMILDSKFPDLFRLSDASNEDSKQKRILYTDGSASPNPGPGGFAVIENGQPIFLGNELKSTNIRMEGFALKSALQILDGQEGEIWTDSEFWINVLTKWAPNWQRNGWKKKTGEISNLDIVKPLFELYSNSNAELKWLKGHAGHDFNELADEWANRAREGEKL